MTIKLHTFSFPSTKSVAAASMLLIFRVLFVKYLFFTTKSTTFRLYASHYEQRLIEMNYLFRFRQRHAADPVTDSEIATRLLQIDVNISATLIIWYNFAKLIFLDEEKQWCDLVWLQNLRKTLYKIRSTNRVGGGVAHVVTRTLNIRLPFTYWISTDQFKSKMISNLSIFHS